MSRREAPGFANVQCAAWARIAPPFNGGTISLEANAMSDGAFTVKVDGNRPFHLTVISKNGRGILDKDITPGKHTFLPKGDEL